MKTTDRGMKMGLQQLVIAVVLLFASVPIAYANTIYVSTSNLSGTENGTLSFPYRTIQRGVNSASSGDIIKVAAGNYTENITINALSVRIIGESPETTKITGSSICLNITGSFSAGSNLVEIAGFTVVGGSDCGIKNSSATALLYIHNNIITGNNNGIFNAYSAIVVNCVIIANSGSGVYINNNGNISVSNSIVVLNKYGLYRYTGIFNSSFNNVWNNTSGDYYGAITKSSDISQDPLFLASYQLASGSPSIDAGRPVATDNDPDGTRNNQGAYGGPGAAGFWPNPPGGPVVTSMTVTPSVPVGGTITLKASGKVR